MDMIDYGIGFNARLQVCLMSDSSWSKSVVIFGTGMSSSVHFDSKRK